MFLSYGCELELLRGALKQERKELKPIPSSPTLAMPGHQLFKPQCTATVGNSLTELRTVM